MSRKIAPSRGRVRRSLRRCSRFVCIFLSIGLPANLGRLSRGNLIGFFGNPLVVRLLNFLIFAALVIYTGQTAQTQHLDHKIYPFDIIDDVKNSQLTLTSSRGFQSPGFVNRRNGTFRTHYPSIGLVDSDTFDEVFVISNRKCKSQLDEFAKRAQERGIRYTIVDSTHATEVSLSSPPLKIDHSALQKAQHHRHTMLSTLKRQIGYTHTHVRIWRQAQSRRRKRILILDNTLFPSAKLIKFLPLMFNQIDEESVARRQPWHLLTFRRTVLNQDIEMMSASPFQSRENPMEEIWSSIPVYGHPIVLAAPSFGASFYALSSQGIEWLLEHVTEYTCPLDKQLLLLQNQFPDEFVVLSGCNNVHRQPLCPEFVLETVPENLKSSHECVWRRLQERSAVQELIADKEGSHSTGGIRN